MNPRATAICGIGATEFSARSGRTELRLAVEAVNAALDDAGLVPSDVDGLVTLLMDNNSEQAVARTIGTDRVTFYARTPQGGGGSCGTLALASMAVETGRADVVVVYRAMNERSQSRFGQPLGDPRATLGRPGLQEGVLDSEDLDASWVMPFGMATFSSLVAQTAQRYLHRYGATGETFGRVSVQQREYAQNNPAAFFHGRPMTLDDHQSSRMIADPLRLLDCCPENDGAVAIVITSLERARDLRSTPVEIVATAQGLANDHFGLATAYRDDISWSTETEIVGDELWARSGLRPSDVDVANLYDHFSCAVVMQLEALGFCGPGEGVGLVADGGLALDGAIPTNTNGGMLSEGYLHGFNGIAELVRQLRGTAVNQVEGARHAIATGGSHVPTSGLLLRSDV